MWRRGFIGSVSFMALSAGLARGQTVLAPAPVPAVNPQAPALGDTIGPGFNRIVLARWGDGILPGAPDFAPEALTVDQAKTQFPYDGIIAGVVAPPAAQDGIARLVMVLANPTAPANMLFAGGVDNPAVAGQMQGATVMNLQYQAGRWVIVAGGYQTRRIDDDTLCQITGPAADAVGTTVQGVLAPSAGCVTPWSTALLAEGDAGPWLTRLAGLGLGYDDPADAARFGWVVELNPLDPGAFPVKRTALGRFTRHGIAATVSADGRPVVFMSAAAGYLFRFLAATNATDGTALDSGALAVAVVLNGALGWAALGQDVASLAGAAGAAAQAGGTAFDGPAGIAIAADGTLYLACQGADPGNNGGIWQLTPDKGDAAAGHFTVQNILIAGKEGNYAPGSPAWFRKPRSLNIDEAGQLWIGTDQGGAGSDTADGYFMIQTGAPGPYEVSMAYLTPVGAAAGGAAFDTTSKTSFAMVRHPGAAPGASFSAPATRWPRFQPGLPPQSTLVGLISS